MNFLRGCDPPQICCGFVAEINLKGTKNIKDKKKKKSCGGNFAANSIQKMKQKIQCTFVAEIPELNM